MIWPEGETGSCDGMTGLRLQQIIYFGEMIINSVSKRKNRRIDLT